MTRNGFLSVLYIVATIAATVYFWRNSGALVAWMFCATACGLPQFLNLQNDTKEEK